MRSVRMFSLDRMTIVIEFATFGNVEYIANGTV